MAHPPVTKGVSPGVWWVYLFECSAERSEEVIGPSVSLEFLADLARVLPQFSSIDKKSTQRRHQHPTRQIKRI